MFFFVIVLTTRKEEEDTIKSYTLLQFEQVHTHIYRKIMVRAVCVNTKLQVSMEEKKNLLLFIYLHFVYALAANFQAHIKIHSRFFALSLF